MLSKFESSVIDAKAKYIKETYRNPKYLIINNNTFFAIKRYVGQRKIFGLIDKKIFKGLYIAIDNELDDYDFIVLG